MRKIGVLVVVVAVAALALPLVNLAVGGPQGTALTKEGPEDPAARKVATLLEGPCADCHVEGVKPPWYAAMPVVSGLLSKDKVQGLEWLDLHEAVTGNGKEPSEAGLAKIERALKAGQMPPAR